MAKLKFAFQSEYYRTHPRQWRDYLFGYFHISAGLAAALAPISNALMGVPALKNLVARIMGMATQRPFPKFASQRAKFKPRGMQKAGRVIFLADPFARYIEPETEQAALDILAYCGYEVQVLPILGAGASFLSKGFIEQAQRHAARVLDLLHQVDPACEVTVVGIEPPEIYALKHDYVDLLPERVEEIRKRAANVRLLDEFLVRSSEFKVLRVASMRQKTGVENDTPKRKVNFHPHCHQRAEGPSPDGMPNGTDATLELLRSCGYDVELMDTGCCGMAGTFGFEAEHYELSMKVGELKLFPALRKSQIANLKSEIVSSGAACRMQIRQGTGAEAIHPIVLVADFVKSRTS